MHKRNVRLSKGDSMQIWNLRIFVGSLFTCLLLHGCSTEDATDCEGLDECVIQMATDETHTVFRINDAHPAVRAYLVGTDKLSKGNTGDVSFIACP